MRALLLADLAQQRIRGCVAGRAFVEVVDLLVLRRLAGGEQPVDRSDPGLQAQPQTQVHTGWVGHLDAELLHALLEPVTVPALGLGHAAQDLGLALVHALGDELIHRAGHDLAAPGLEQPVTDISRGLGHRRTG